MSLVKKYLPEIIYGGMDGSTTTFAIITGAFGAGFSTNVIVTLGIANLVADGFAMAIGNYLSVQTIMENNYKKPVDTANATFLAVGAIPLLSYALSYVVNVDHNNIFMYACLLTILAFSIIGYLKSKINNTSIVKGITETLLLGCIASLISFLLGYYLEKILLLVVSFTFNTNIFKL